MFTYVHTNLKPPRVTNKSRVETPLLTHKEMIFAMEHTIFLTLETMALAGWGKRSHEVTGCISWPARSKFLSLLVRFSVAYDVVIPREHDRGAKHFLQPSQCRFSLLCSQD